MDLTQIGAGRYKAVNVRGGVLPIGSGDDPDFTPVELLLAALAGCTAIDVGLITGKRAQPDDFDVHVEGHKVRDDGGSHLVDLSVTVAITLPRGGGRRRGPRGAAARHPADRRPAVHGRPDPPARHRRSTYGRPEPRRASVSRW